MTNPAPGRRFAPLSLSQQTHRQLIGYLGLVLPLLLYVLAGVRHTDGLPNWAPLPSISAYYYTGAVAAFIGVIASLSLFLFSYRGYEGVASDRIVGSVGGAGAVGVILFPTTPPAASLRVAWWNNWMATVHYASAVILFIAFILFAIWLFRQSDIAEHAARPSDKQWRDRACLWCGIIMIVAIAWAGWAGSRDASIFYQESVAIEAFAISWLVKGEAHQSLARAMQRLRREPDGGPTGRNGESV
jgi:heme A synthase